MESEPQKSVALITFVPRRHKRTGELFLISILSNRKCLIVSRDSASGGIVSKELTHAWVRAATSLQGKTVHDEEALALMDDLKKDEYLMNLIKETALEEKDRGKDIYRPLQYCIAERLRKAIVTKPDLIPGEIDYYTLSRKEKLEYQRKYPVSSRPKVKTYMKEYIERNRSKLKKYHMEYYRKNRERKMQYMREYRAKLKRDLERNLMKERNCL